MFHYIEIYFARKLIVNIIRKTGNENPIIDERVDPLTWSIEFEIFNIVFPSLWTVISFHFNRTPISSIFFWQMYFANSSIFIDSRLIDFAGAKKKKKYVIIVIFLICFSFSFYIYRSKQTIFFLNNRDIKHPTPNTQKMNQWNVACCSLFSLCSSQLFVNFSNRHDSKFENSKKNLKKIFSSFQHKRKIRKRLKNLDENICTHFQFASTFNSLVLIHENRKNNPWHVRVGRHPGMV